MSIDPTTAPAQPSGAAQPAGAERRVVRGGLDSLVGAFVLVTAAVVLALLPLVVSTSWTSRLITLCTYIVLAVMWNLLAGFGGMVSIGQQAYIGLGAYGLVVLADRIGLDPFLSIPVAGVIAGIVAIPVSFLAFRLVGGYFAIGTWVIAEVARLVTVQFEQVGRGSGVSVRALSGADATARIELTYWWALGLAILAVSVSVILARSPLGVALTAIRDEPTAAASNGVNVTRVKRIVFVISAAGCGAAGAMIALSSLRVQPDSVFGVQWTAFMIFMVVIGGIGTLEGPIIGALVFFALQQALGDYGATYLVVLGVVAILVVLLAPRGLWGLLGGAGRVQLFPIRYRVLAAGRGERR